MNRKISQWVADWIFKNNQSKKSMQPIVRYGIEAMLNSFLKVFVLLTIGCMFGKFYETVVVLCSFGLLRKFAGGVHCKTDIGCFLSMFVICAISMLFSENSEKIPIGIMSMELVFVWLSLMCFAPCNSKVNPIMDRGVLEQKRKGTIIVITGLSMLILLIPIREWKWLILCPVFIEAITVLPLIEMRGE